jgi:hypothetical protein
MTGLWLGLIFFILFGTAPSTTNPGTTVAVFNIGSAILVGAGFGMLFQVLRFSLSKNKRGFSSTSQVVAKKYEVLVPSELLNEATTAYEKGGELKA